MMNNLQSSAFVAKTTQLLSSVARLRLLLVMLLTLTASTAWGATAEFAPTNFSGQGTSGTGSAISATVNGVTFACDKGYGTTQIRCYSGSTITISSSNTITAISFTFSENKYTGGLATSYTNLNTNSWEMALSSQARITKCVVTYEEASTDPYTVTFHTTATSETELTEDAAGAGVTPPTMEKECGDWTFQGWSESFSVSETSTTKLDLVTLDEGIYYPAADVDLYPVYTKSDGEGGTAYTKVTTISEGVYVMVSEKTSGTYKYMPNTTSSGANPTLGSGITTSTTNGITSLTNEVTDAMLWDFTSTGTTNQFYLRPHGSTTIGLGCTTSTGANIRISSTYKDVKWTITTSSSYGWQFKSNASSAMYLAVYSDSNWRNYTSSTTNQNGKFHLFKQTGSSTTYYYSYPQCVTETTVSLIPKITIF